MINSDEKADLAGALGCRRGSRELVQIYINVKTPDICLQMSGVFLKIYSDFIPHHSRRTDLPRQCGP